MFTSLSVSRAMLLKPPSPLPHISPIPFILFISLHRTLLPPLAFVLFFIEQVAIWNESKINGLACGTQCRTQDAGPPLPAAKLPYKMAVKSNTFYMPLFLISSTSWQTTHSAICFFMRTSWFSFVSECSLLRPHPR